MATIANNIVDRTKYFELCWLLKTLTNEIAQAKAFEYYTVYILPRRQDNSSKRFRVVTAAATVLANEIANGVEASEH